MVGIKRDRQIQPALASGDIRDVGHPPAVGSGHCKLSSQYVLRDGMDMARVRRSLELPFMSCHDLVLANQLGHAELSPFFGQLACSVFREMAPTKPAAGTWYPSALWGRS